MWHGISFNEPNPTRSRPSDLIGLCKLTQDPPPTHTREGKDKPPQTKPGGGRLEAKNERRRQRKERGAQQRKGNPMSHPTETSEGAKRRRPKKRGKGREKEKHPNGS